MAARAVSPLLQALSRLHSPVAADAAKESQQSKKRLACSSPNGEEEEEKHVAKASKASVEDDGGSRTDEALTELSKEHAVPEGENVDEWLAEFPEVDITTSYSPLSDAADSPVYELSHAGGVWPRVVFSLPQWPLDDAVWCETLGVVNLDEAARMQGNLQVAHIVDRSGSTKLYIPLELQAQITSLTTSSDSRRTARLTNAQCFPRLVSLALSNGLALPRRTEVLIPVEFRNQSSPNFTGAAEAQRTLPYADLGHLVFPVLRDLSLRLFQEHGWRAGLEVLGTMSHVNGTLTLIFQCVGTLGASEVKLMQQFLRFPHVKALRIRFWEEAQGPASGTDKSNAALARLWLNIATLLQGLFGHPDQVWRSLRRLELDLLSESINSRDSLKQVMLHSFPFDDWSAVLRHSPILTELGWMCPEDASWRFNTARHARHALEPFVYALVIARSNSQSWHPPASQTMKLLESASDACPLRLIELLCMEQKVAAPIRSDDAILSLSALSAELPQYRIDPDERWSALSRTSSKLLATLASRHTGAAAPALQLKVNLTNMDQSEARHIVSLLSAIGRIRVDLLSYPNGRIVCALWMKLQTPRSNVIRLPELCDHPTPPPQTGACV